MSTSSMIFISSSTTTLDTIVNAISKFMFNRGGITLDAWFKHHEDSFMNDCKNWDEIREQIIAKT